MQIKIFFEYISEIKSTQGLLGLTTFLSIFFASIIYFLMGQNLISPSGEVQLWSFIINGKESSQHIADWYTPSHVIHGILFFFGFKYFFEKFFSIKLNISQLLILAIVTEGVWEIIENSDFVINRYREVTIGSEYFGDSVINSFCDIWWCTLGFFIAWRMPLWFSISFLIFFEVLVAYFIRDNLALNIIMLLYPLEFIKTWQLSI